MIKILTSILLTLCIVSCQKDTEKDKQDIENIIAPKDLITLKLLSDVPNRSGIFTFKYENHNYMYIRQKIGFEGAYGISLICIDCYNNQNKKGN